MMIDSNIQAIEDRRAAIAEAIAKLKEEDARLAIALEVIDFFSTSSSVESKPALSTDAANKGAPRPDGIPTLFEMTYEALADVEQKGKRGLTSKGIVSWVESTYWPGVKSHQVLPSLYGYIKDGRLKKSKDGLFSIARKKEAPPAQAGDASKLGSIEEAQSFFEPKS